MKTYTIIKNIHLKWIPKSCNDEYDPKMTFLSEYVWRLGMLLLKLTLSALPLEDQGLICQKLTVETIRIS